MTATDQAESDARLNALLDERSARLARRRVVEDAAGDDQQVFLVCVCGTERIGLPIAHAGAVLPLRHCTKLPGAPVVLRGIVALSGSIVTVIDLGAATGRASQQSDEPGYIVRLRGQAPPLALAVDQLVGVVAIDPSTISKTATGLGGDVLSGYAAPGSGASGGRDGFAIIDLPRLLRRFLP